MTVYANKKKRRRVSVKDDDHKQQVVNVILSDMLPEEIMFDILSRLPAKSLMRFKSVSKSWNNLIQKDTIFINMHLARSKIQHQSSDHYKIILINNRYRGHMSRRTPIYSLDYKKTGKLELLNRRHSRLRHVFPDHGRFLGTCNGLVCTIEAFPRSHLYIWNPCTTDFRKIRQHCFKRQLGVSSCYGFAYNSIANDYLVLQLKELIRNNNQFGSAVAIYSLQYNSWRRMQDIPYTVSFTTRGQLVNASFHWKADSKITSASSNVEIKRVLLAFEISSEKFRELSLPDLVLHKESCDWMVNEYQEKLCIFHAKDQWGNNIDLWVMSNYGVSESWTKRFNIQKPEDLTIFGLSAVVLCTTKEGSILMNSDICGNLILYNPKYRTRRRIEGFKPYEAEAYIPSLVAVNSM